MSALNKIKNLFPGVEKVVDAKKTINITVTKRDVAAGSKKDFYNCALAKACKRSHIADKVIIGIAYCYLIKGKKATRYKTSQVVSREIVSFDRHHDFAEGANYKLSKVPKSNRFGYKRDFKPKTGKGYKPKMTIHSTIDVRRRTSGN